MSWDYAELSSLAKDNGGPQALIDKITNEAYQQGTNDEKTVMELVLALAIPIAVGVGAGLHWGYCKVRDSIKVKQRSNTKIEQLQNEVIRGIDEYDNQVSQDNAIPDDESIQ